jgi:ubiquinone/menaquinone biosynthesis C-methylase UbiE
MSDNDYWEKAFESGEYRHWEFNYSSPELVAIVAAGVPRKGEKVLDVGCGGGADAIFMAHVDSEL